MVCLKGERRLLSLPSCLTFRSMGSHVCDMSITFSYSLLKAISVGGRSSAESFSEVDRRVLCLSMVE
jgi:hypothetical protein